MEKTNWKLDRLNKLSAIEKKLSVSEIRSLKIKKLHQIIKTICIHAEEGCIDCTIYQDTLERMVDMIHNGSVNYREYNNLYSLILNHLVRTHSVTQKWLQLYMSVFISICSGILIGIFVLKNMSIGILFGAISGILIGSVLEILALKKGNQL